MRADAIAPRTWLLAAIAVWALLAWLLAVSGLGRRVAPLPDDPALRASLPQWHAPAAERLGVLSEYAPASERSLFNEDRRPRPFYIEGAENGEAAPSFDFVLSSVLITPGMRMAILQSGNGGEPVRLKQGESSEALPGWRLVEVQPRRATLEGPEGPRTLELRVFDGNGGQAPTAATADPAPAPANGGAPINPPAPPSGGNANAAPAPAKSRGDGSGTQQPPPTAIKTTEEQMETIRRRIEARRKQLRDQQQQNARQNPQ